MIEDSFKCGLLLFAINLLFAITKITPILLLTAIILPGLLFGILIVNQAGNVTSINKGLFIISSGTLYIFTSWVATGARSYTLPYLIVFATTIGAVLLFLIYKYLLNRSIDIRKGLFLSIGTGIISSILPIVGIYHDSNIEGDWIKLACLFSVFPIWQPLFTWTIQKLKDGNASPLV